MTSSTKVALFGIAGYGDFYLQTLLNDDRCRGVEFVGCVENAPRRCSRLDALKSRQVPVFSNLDDLFDYSGVDLAMIATPIHLHASQTIAALSNGAHVLCEKPLATTLRDAQSMSDAERASGRFVAIGYQWAFSGAMQSLKREILVGTFGRPRRFKSIVYFPRPVSYFKRNSWAGCLATSAGEPVLDSPVNNANAHHLQIMLYLLGSARENSASPRTVQSERYRVHDIENFDTVAMRIITDTDVEVLFYASHCVPDRVGPLFRFEFEDAVIQCDDNDNIIARFNNGEVRTYGRCSIDHADKIFECLRAARSGDAVACGIPAAMSHTLCVVAAHHSATPIQTIPRRFIHERSLDHDVLLVVDGLATAMRQCFDQNILLGEAGNIAWARPSRPVDTKVLPMSGTSPAKVTVTVAEGSKEPHPKCARTYATRSSEIGCARAQ